MKTIREGTLERRSAVVRCCLSRKGVREFGGLPGARDHVASRPAGCRGRLAVQVGLLSPEHRTEFQIYIRMSEFKSNGLNYEHERLSPAHFTNVNQPLEPGAVGHYNRRVRGIRRASESGPR